MPCASTAAVQAAPTRVEVSSSAMMAGPRTMLARRQGGAVVDQPIRHFAAHRVAHRLAARRGGRAGGRRRSSCTSVSVATATAKLITSTSEPGTGRS